MISVILGENLKTAQVEMIRILEFLKFDIHKILKRVCHMDQAYITTALTLFEKY